MDSRESYNMSQMNTVDYNDYHKQPYTQPEPVTLRQHENNAPPDYTSTQPLLNPQSVRVVTQSPPPIDVYQTHLTQSFIRASSQHPQPLYVKVASYIEWSICNIVCCFFVCFPILFCSIPALLCSNKARDKMNLGLYDDAQKHSKYARVLNIISSTYVLIFFIVCTITIIALVIYAFVAALPFIEAIKQILEIFNQFFTFF